MSVPPQPATSIPLDAARAPLTVSPPSMDALTLLAAIVQGSDDAIYAKDLNGVILSWNPGAERLYGYTAAEMIGRHVAMLVPPELRDDSARLFERVRAKQGIRHHETVRIRRDGRRIHVSLTISPIVDGRGEVVGGSTIARDVTRERVEQRRLELLSELGRALSEELDEEQILRELADRLVPELADYCVTYLAYGREIRRVGVAHAEPAEEVYIRRLAALPPPSFDDPTGPGAVVRTGEPVFFPSVSPADLKNVADGEYLEVLTKLDPRSTIVVPLRARHRSVGAVALAATARSGRVYGEEDLSLAQELGDRAALALDNARLFSEAQAQLRQRRTAEEQLRQRFEQLRTLYEMTESAARATSLQDIYGPALDGLVRTLHVDRASILLLEEDGVMRFVAWRGLSDGYRAAVEGHSPWTVDMVDPEPITIEDVQAAPDLPDELRRTILDEGIRALAFIPLTFGSRLLGKFMLYYDRPHAFGPEEVGLARTVAGTIGFTIIRMQNEQRLRRAMVDADSANRAKLNFLGMMSHELRTPLNAIGGYVELLQLEINGPTTQDQQKSLGRIAANQRHLLGLINDILSFARLEAAQVDYDLREVWIRKVIAALGAIIEPLASAKGVEYHVTTAGCGRAAALGDEERIRQILVNLVSNAIKFTPEGGQVSLTCESDDDWLVVRVRDTGRGIDPGHQAVIFEPFVQLGDGAKSERSGVGLGLAISREFARGMGGEISVSSTPGEGSEFTLRLPASHRSPVENASETATEASAANA